MKDGESGLAAALTVSDAAPELSVVDAPSPKEETDLKLQQTSEQLATLRRQQQDLERQKAELEDLRRKQDEYARGKAAMIEQLNRGLVRLEREQQQAESTAELCAASRRAFRDCLDQLHTIHDEQWTSENLRAELSCALALVENARLEHGRALAKLPCLAVKDETVAGTSNSPSAPASLREGEFRRYVKIGLAASLPIIVTGTIWLMIFLAAKH